jgi:UDP-glucose:(heptosyl)LPS alpha-1,3-glucosyltransferase
VLAISERVAGQIQRRYQLAPGQLDVIHPGVDTERFRPDVAARRLLRAELGLAEGAVAVAFVGSDWQRKGLASLLEALASEPELWLLVLGRERRSGAWRARAEALGIGRRTRFLGWRSDPERVLAAADIFALPTRFDAFANAALEALATGLPLVVSRRAGAAELVVEGKTGSVIDPDDADGLVAALRTWRDPALRAEAARLARETALRHSWERHYERVLRVYEELVTPAR